MLPAIVVNAYQRPSALERLLASLRGADYPDGARIPLVISIDGGGDPEVRTLADRFEWPFGDKRVIVADQNLGVVQHFFVCGDLSREYGSIIYLEDDLLVSPVFYHFAAQALPFYGPDSRVGGVSLYALWFNGYTQQPFVPLEDGSDVFFLQVPYTQGLAVTRAQWERFVAWLESEAHAPRLDLPLHQAWLHFRDAHDWFPMLARFVIATDRFWVYPRLSLTTGFGDAGEHFSAPTTFFQVPLQRSKTRFALNSLDDSLAAYDSFFEMRPERLDRLTSALRAYDYDVDLYATKSRRQLHSTYALTTRPCRKPVASFALSMWPMEANVVHAVPGCDIHLCRAADLQWDRLSRLVTWRRHQLFFTRGRPPGVRTRLKLALAAFVQKLRRDPGRPVASRAEIFRALDKREPG
jgi:hypothetical protein